MIDTISLFVPIGDPSHEGRDQENTRVGASNGLSLREQESQVAIHPLLLKNFGGTYPFPGCGQLDQHAVFRDASLSVICDDLLRAPHGAIDVEGEACVHLG